MECATMKAKPKSKPMSQAEVDAWNALGNAATPRQRIILIEAMTQVVKGGQIDPVQFRRRMGKCSRRFLAAVAALPPAA
jgi:hypothetical protein